METTISGELAEEAKCLLENMPPKEVIDYSTIGAFEIEFIRSGLGYTNVEPIIEVDENISTVNIPSDTITSQSDSLYSEHSENFEDIQNSFIENVSSYIAPNHECKHKRKLRKLLCDIQNTIEKLPCCDCIDCVNQKRKKNKH